MQLKADIKKYFKEIFIKNVNKSLFKKFVSTESGNGKTPNKIDWDFFIIFTTSVLANASQDKISEAIKSIKNVFDESKKLLLIVYHCHLITNIILKIMNLKIRPILVSSIILEKMDAHSNHTINDENFDNNIINFV